MLIIQSNLSSYLDRALQEIRPYNDAYTNDARSRLLDHSALCNKRMKELIASYNNDIKQFESNYGFAELQRVCRVLDNDREKLERKYGLVVGEKK